MSVPHNTETRLAILEHKFKELDARGDRIEKTLYGIRDTMLRMEGASLLAKLGTHFFSGLVAFTAALATWYSGLFPHR